MTEATRQPAPAPALSRVAVYILLAIGPEERHGYAIMHEVRRITGGAVRLGSTRRSSASLPTGSSRNPRSGQTPTSTTSAGATTG